uniref:Uncharacterized protein n=1 Tax=Rhizophora mucronata TaxID=61149 RepID=A0A2P2N4L5_RHIMU
MLLRLSPTITKLVFLLSIKFSITTAISSFLIGSKTFDLLGSAST